MLVKEEGRKGCPSGVYWIIEPGDSFWKISRAMGVPLWKLIQANPQFKPWNLPVGGRVCIPD
ncbi:MAG: LysM domain-containing protein [Desulfitobacterium hafniense]|nr:LysM domain-containing protein [Desulfitobacterium hafniense]